MDTTRGQGSGRSGGPGWGTGVLVGCLAGVVAVCTVGAAGVWLAASRLGLMPDTSTADGTGLGALVLLALVLVVIAAGHVAASVWAWRTRPGRVVVLLTQVPHLAGYLTVPAWWAGTWSAWFILWGVVALAAPAWLTVWYLHAPRVARRAVIYLSGMVVLVAGNAAGVAAVVWDRTNGFGLRGQPTPWAAVTALTAASCLSDSEFFNDGDRLVEADCPSGPNADFYACDYDEANFGDMLCGQQPRQAFEKWWEWNHDFALSFRLAWEQGRTMVDGWNIRPPFPDRIDGNTATIEYTMTLESATHTGEDDPYSMAADKKTETWTVRLESVALGGWKVCHIDITDPITATFTPR